LQALTEFPVIGVVAFVTTNVDGLLVLMIFLADRAYDARHIVLGQLAAVALWLLISVGIAHAALALPTQWLALLGVLPVGLGLLKLVELRRADGAAEIAPLEPATQGLLKRVHSRAGAVALVAVSNGADNIALYVALFANSTRAEITGFSVLFLVLAGLWCGLAHALVRTPWLGARIGDGSQKLLPFILIGLGVHILSKGLVGGSG
jgi:cadmium resistance protein CadD (predicted permease)